MVNGGCIPGEFNAVTTPNIGEPCEDDSECWSPFGRGTCIQFTNGHSMCTVRDCGSPIAVLTEEQQMMGQACPYAKKLDGRCLSANRPR